MNSVLRRVRIAFLKSYISNQSENETSYKHIQHSLLIYTSHPHEIFQLSHHVIHIFPTSIQTRHISFNSIETLIIHHLVSIVLA